MHSPDALAHGVFGWFSAGWAYGLLCYAFWSWAWGRE